MGLSGFVWVTSVFGMSMARRGTTWTQDSGVAWIRHADVRAAARRTASHHGLQPIAPCVKLVQSSALEAAISIKITHGGIDSANSADSAFSACETPSVSLRSPAPPAGEPDSAFSALSA